MAPGLSCSVACGIFLDQGLTKWQFSKWPLDGAGSPGGLQNEMHLSPPAGISPFPHLKIVELHADFTISVGKLFKNFLLEYSCFTILH